MAIDSLYPSETKIAVMTDFLAGRKPMIHGDPGIGKSEIVQQIADELFAEKYGFKINSAGRVVTSEGKFVAVSDKPYYKEIRSAQYDAVDLRGLCDIESSGKKKSTVWIRPEELPTNPVGGILFYDELNRGSELVQNALFQALDQNRIGPHVLPPTWYQVSAVNDKDIGAKKMSSALMLRFHHLDMQPSIDDLYVIAKQRDWDQSVVAFLLWRQQHPHAQLGSMLHHFESGQRSGRNPRSWEHVSQIVKATNGKLAQVPAHRRDNLFLAQIAGSVGEPAAIEFIGFRRLYADLPSIQDILKNPSTVTVPVNPAARYAITLALSAKAVPDNFKSVLTYLGRMGKEFEVMGVRDAVRNNELESVPEFTNWCIANSDVTFAR